MADTLRLPPEICACADEKYENLEIQVVLPGVEKENISFKLTDVSFYVKAQKEGLTYLDSYSICCPVDPEKAVARYSNGVLKVTVPFLQPMERLVDVKIK
jgi:HSP20 family molecular chaperone IbpA